MGTRKVESRKEENEKVERRKEENEDKDENKDDDYEDEDETMSQNEKNGIIKEINDNLDEIIYKSKSFEEQIKLFKKEKI